MGRPSKSETERRSELIRFTVRPAEYVRIQQAAAAAGKSVADYARSMVLSGRIVMRQARRLDHNAFDQLRRIGVNLNQAVKVLHATGRMPPELPSAAATVERFLMETLDDGPEGGG